MNNLTPAHRFCSTQPALPGALGVASAYTPLTELEMARFCVERDRGNLANLEASGGLQHAYAALGRANRIKGGMRRHWQAKAFRAINEMRASLRAARKALAASELALLALTPTGLAA